MVAAAPDLETQLAATLAEVRTEIDVPRRRRIFCNRNLRMDQVELIGFDMDYTLALYHQERLEQLSITLTLAKLVEKHGYPDEIRALHYDSQWAIRGLMVDRQLGNVFKMDRHSHVGRCFHGFRKLTSAERKQLYRNEKINLSSDRYEWIDTLFGLPEAVMYVTIVDWFDRNRPGEADYDKLFGDIRLSIDEAHRDDTLKSVIRAEPDAYIVKDPDLAETLHKLRSSGKKLFLCTNSLYDYTDAVMSFLLNGQRTPYPSWRNYFDVVIVGAAKPAFFNEQRPFVALDPATGRALPSEVKQFSRDRVYQGGNVLTFEELTHIRGENVLYIGDHIYGDILRLRKQRTWRTAMVIQELDREIAVSERLEGQIRDLDLLDRRHRNLESEIDFQALRLKRLQRLAEEANAVTAANLIAPPAPSVAAIAAGASMMATPTSAAPLTPVTATLAASFTAAQGALHGAPGGFGLPEPVAGEPGPSSARALPTVSAGLRSRIEDARRQIKTHVDGLRDRARMMGEEVEMLEDATERAFNPYWGSILREGNEGSRFGEQVGDYADLYTSRVSNFLSYSPLRYFRAPRRAMPHEL
ncbi:MAG TPA: HAD-IG family 5'-nucleotidase [Kofleriaceae bacterium]|nr:HAD-IG family 5'-nucleotidase [Kofleriaceae bacterium]